MSSGEEKWHWQICIQRLLTRLLFPVLFVYALVSYSEYLRVSTIGNGLRLKKIISLNSTQTELSKILPPRFVSSQKETSSIEDIRSNHRPETPTLPLTLFSPYVITNTDICRNVAHLAYIIIVHTAINHFERRDIIRKTWANTTLFPSGRCVFLFGTTRDSDQQNQLYRESEKYKDIIQGDFLDSYHNLTNKGVLGLRWVNESCSNTHVVLKVDDDIVFNIYQFLETYFQRLNGTKRIMMGQTRYHAPVNRVKRAKWYVGDNSSWFVGKKTYPLYVPGLWVGLSMSLAKAMYQNAFNTPFFWIDDVYLFGLLPRGLNVTYIDIGNVIAFNVKRQLSCYRKNPDCKTMVGHGTDGYNECWNAILQQVFKTK